MLFESESIPNGQIFSQPGFPQMYLRHAMASFRDGPLKAINMARAMTATLTTSPIAINKVSGLSIIG